MNNSVKENHWFGDAPKHWEIKKIASLYKLRNEKVSDKDFPPLSVSMKGIVPQLETAAKTNDGDNRKLVRKGDFAINSRSDRRGSCGISDYDGSVSLINTVLQPRKNMHPKFYDWFFHSTRFADEFYRWGHGIVDDLWTTGWQDMKKISILYPPLDEQKKIADFLDEKCAEIDGLISDLNEGISTLKEYKRSTITEAVCKGLNPNAEMKDSGIFYLGSINKDWTISRIGYVCSKLHRPFETTDTPLICSNKGKVLVRDDNVVGLMASDDNAMQGISKGDIAIHGMDTWHGAIAISENDGKITRVVHVCDSIINKKFVVYYLQHLAFQGVYKLISNGVRENTSDFRSWEKVKSIYITIPSRTEQDSIADFLENKCNNIEAIISEKKEQISILEQYKKSVIYEYTTGKKEVV